MRRLESPARRLHQARRSEFSGVIIMAGPLFPDNLDHHEECWNCGSKDARGYLGSFSYVCSCGCGWSNRYGVDEAAERAQKTLRDVLYAQSNFGIELVDFTKPGAPSSPG